MNSLPVKLSLAATLLLAGAATAFALLTARSDAADGGKASDALRAIATARAATPSGTPYDVESERRAGARIWEVKLGTGGGTAVEVAVSADGKRVLGRHALARPDAEAGWVGSAKVGLTAALRTASSAVAGPFDEAELDREQVGLVWSASFGRGVGEIEIEVDAASGRVVGHDAD